MGKGAIILNPNNRRKNSDHKIRSATRKLGGDRKVRVVVMGSIAADEQLRTFLKTNEPKFPAAIEALKGKFTGFEKMSLDQMIERINQFIATMSFGTELLKEKNVVVIEKQLLPILARAEDALQEIAW